MYTLINDVRYGLRVLIKSPSSTFIAIIALALGIGANSAIFSVVNAVLLRPLPFYEPQKLVWLSRYHIHQSKNPEQGSVSYPEVKDWQEQSQSLESIAAFVLNDVSLKSGDRVEHLPASFVSSQIFPLLGVNAEYGRTLAPEDDKHGSPPVAVISHNLWKRWFGSSPDVLGQIVSIDARDFTIVGVMPGGFKFPLDEHEPVELMVSVSYGFTEFVDERGAEFLSAIGRVKSDSTIEAAQADMEAIAARLAEQYPDTNKDFSIKVTPLHEKLVGTARTALTLIFAAVGLVLLIACANIANLQLSRATSRQKEFAIRTALGASRWRIVRQLLTESLLLALVGGGLGLLLAMWGIDALSAMVGESLPRSREINLDLQVLGFTLVVALATGLIFGLAPALQISRFDLNSTLKEGTRGAGGSLSRNRMRRVLIITEVALSLILLIGAGLMVRSFYRINQVSPGFNPDNVTTMEFSLPTAKYDEDDSWASFNKQLLERAKNIAGVQSVAAITTLPLSGSNLGIGIYPETYVPAPGEKTSANYRAISPDYFQVMGIPIKSGRAFTEQDIKGSPNVLIINESLARRYFPGQNPLGQKVKIGYNDLMCEVVGIVGDVKHSDLKEEAGEEMYTPFQQTPWWFMSLVVRTGSDAASVVAALRAEVAAIDDSVPAYNVKTMNEYLSASIAQPRLYMTLLAIFASVALILAAVGIYGVISYSVTQRTHEIGVRMALGARPRDVLKMVVGQAMAIAVAGVVVGVGGGLIIVKVISSALSGLLFEVSPTDLATFLIIPLIMAGVALAASFVPARRATRVDPMVALRYE